MSEVDKTLDSIKESIATMDEITLRDAAIGLVDLLQAANNTIEKQNSAMSMGEQIMTGLAKLVTEMQQELSALGNKTYEESEDLQSMLNNLVKLSELV